MNGIFNDFFKQNKFNNPTENLLNDLNERLRAAPKEQLTELFAEQANILKEYEQHLSHKLLVLLRDAGASADLALTVSAIIADLLNVHDNTVTRLVLHRLNKMESEEKEQ